MAELSLPPLQASGPQSGLQQNPNYMPGAASPGAAGTSAEQGDLGDSGGDSRVLAVLDTLGEDEVLNLLRDEPDGKIKTYCWGGFLEGVVCPNHVDKKQSGRACFYCADHQKAVRVPLDRVRIAEGREASPASWTGKGSGFVKDNGFSTPYKRIVPPPPAAGSRSGGGSSSGGDGIGKLFNGCANKKPGPALLVSPHACGEADFAGPDRRGVPRVMVRGLVLGSHLGWAWRARLAAA